MRCGGNDDKMMKASVGDPWLEPYRPALEARQNAFARRVGEIDRHGGLLGSISQGHRIFGFNRGYDQGLPGLWFREWAPAAQALSLIGDFNHWDADAHFLTQQPGGVWSLFLPDLADGTPRIAHASRVKLKVRSQERGEEDRIPSYIRRAIQDPQSGDFSGQHWLPPEAYEFRHEAPVVVKGAALRIYEAHVGMAREEERVGTFCEFTRDVLPRIARLGYNCVQLMAVLEHPYYGSFGYHVSNFFAVSSRFGTPEDLKQLIDTAHGLGLRVLLDLVHSHAVRNTHEGLNLLDGSAHQYFHAGPRGLHAAWDSMVFDYAKPEVQQFLLSNARYWLEEFRFDGFRLDGVTSMLYRDHGLGRVFSSYADYFGENVDEDALMYLKLANRLVHRLRPHAITIAEDVSGMPGMARPIEEGGLGFDYRLAMGVPDHWIRLIKEQHDEAWDLGELFRTILNRRFDEKHVGYVESHDQALVGDKTLAFRLMDQAMYDGMSRATPATPVIDRGIALHKLIRLFTFALAGDAWLSFMGNEFGHPEWIDFPRQGNAFSYRHARRQWSLADRGDLRYSGLEEFDRALQLLDEQFHLLSHSAVELLTLHESDRVIAFQRGSLEFIFNFDPVRSYSEYRIPLPSDGDRRLVLSTDEPRFEGHGRVPSGVNFPIQNIGMQGYSRSLQIYLPSRCGLILNRTKINL
jgi:1,4-alpha-glucan branching enzyme